MKKIIFLILIVTSISCYSLEIVLFGGGGEGEKKSTIFDDGLKELAKKKQELNLNIKSVFNSGHPDTEAILRDELKVENASFDSKNYEKMILELTYKIKSGKIKEGEKLLIIVDTHGGVKTQKHQTHSIAMVGSSLSDLTKIEGDQTDSMDKLKNLSELALSKGIKLGILDFSCHSGNSLSLANQNTCVITASGPNHFAFVDFAQNFYSEMKTGLSLEDVFLNTKNKYTAPAFPMISTKAGLSLNNELYSLISPYLNIVTEDGSANKLQPYLDQVANHVSICQREDNFSLLIKKIESFAVINGMLNSQNGIEKQLIDALEDYKKYQDEMIVELQGYNQSKLNENIQLEYFEYSTNKGIKAKKKQIEKIKIGDLFISYHFSSVTDFQKDLVKELSKKPTNQEAIDLNEFLIDKYTRVEELRKKILTQYPNLLKVGQFYKNLPTKHAEVWKKASKVQELANLIYAKSYQDKKQTSSPNEICADFKL